MIQIANTLAAQIDNVEQLAKTVRRDSMQVSRDQGELMATIALSHQARTIVEIGTSYGFSGLWWLTVLSQCEGHLHTFDISQKKYDAASRTFADAGMSDHVTCYLGPALEHLHNVPDVIDLVFIDADKDTTRQYFDILWPKVRSGGAILTDNVLSHRDEMGDYLDMLRQRDDAHTVTIPIRAGLEWTIKLA